MRKTDRNADRFKIGPNAIPKEILRMAAPEYIKQRLAMPVAARQLWLATTDTAMQYVLITEVGADGRTITVLPMSNIPSEQTCDALVIEHTPMGVPMVVWPDFATQIPVRLLHKPMDEFSESTLEAITQKLIDGVEIKQGQAPDELMNRPAIREYQAMQSRMRKWHAMCDDLPKLGGESDLGYQTDDALTRYSEALKTVLHLSPAERLAVSRGKKLTEEQQRKMSKAGFGEQPRKEEVISDDYLIMAEQPRWRFVADAVAHVGDGDPRVELARRAQFDLAARTSGHGEAAMKGAFEKAAELMLKESDGQ